MPFPVSARAESLATSVYRVGRAPEGIKPVPLNVGDTFLPPPQMDLDLNEPHRYTPPAGLPGLREGLAKRMAERSGVPVLAEQVMITPGGTAALSAVVGALVDPGDAVLICAPYWPLIAGIVRVSMGNAVAVPLFTEALDGSTVRAKLEYAHRPGTKALYVNAIHNPTGRILTHDGAQALVEFAREHDLWILSDEVYEDFIYSDLTPPRIFSLAPERTVQVGSASKAFGIAGARVGWGVGPVELISAALKVHLNTSYCAPLFSQRMVAQCLTSVGERWQAHARTVYAKAGADAAKRLGLNRPLSGQFMFVDVAHALDRQAEEPLLDLLRRCLQKGVSLAPGSSCGPYPEHVRLCFTSAPPDDVARGVEILAQELGR